ncbi:trypsin-like peptidase domain-containing protein [Amorphoplanes digitatis]|uniref:Effector-associated domain-containing protein n=1 Tax=Actinoplanes digitatis TaxID=1868 RepID=A0A7W7I114_9ACTN|nr:trypsin-like peptidase domain-containing protein [Actinoplanes digitatis]MBB4764503.1 hypothetical protein [Actinoplanes digitatis]BFE73966.1 hypothetical protein GCM10020092_072670 [Actinoplanes digitatis]GID91545.1 hypothetical protein Adi01nite_09570 [Actinoplanes digitatis]
MLAGQLSGPEILVLRELLYHAFPPDDFTDLLLTFSLAPYRDAATSDSHWTTVRKVVQAANARFWWKDLIAAARTARPEHPGLIEFGQNFGLAPVIKSADGARNLTGREFQLTVREANSSLDFPSWLIRGAQAEGRVCRVEFPEGTPRGTGFLVGPDVVMTVYHVIEQVHLGRIPSSQVCLRFDHKRDLDGITQIPGTVHTLAPDWLIDHSPPGDGDLDPDSGVLPLPHQLDHALLRVADRVGEQPVGAPLILARQAPRRWIELPVEPHDFARLPALHIVHHPEKEPLQVSLDTDGVIGLNANGTRIRYRTNTKGGSSGSPCFGPDWQWVAMHQNGDPSYRKGGPPPAYNEGIPLSALRDLLTASGAISALGG